VSSDAKTLVKVMHRKIVFVKVESSVIELSESVHWSRRFGEKWDPTERHPVNIRFTTN